VLGFAGSALADSGSPESTSLLPQKIREFSQTGRPVPTSTLDDGQSVDTRGVPVPVNIQVAEYAGKNGDRARVSILQFRHEGEAYEIFSFFSQNVHQAEIANNIGTANILTKDETAFVKGTNFVRVTNLKGSPATELAQDLSQLLDKGEGDIPVLIKHLPNPEEAQKHAVYLPSFPDLKRLQFQHPVFDAVQSGGNADAAFATYGASKVLIVEFNTPQLAKENDQRIIARIQELWKLGQPAPTAYRRVGNYSVFVFEAPDEQTAKQLIDQVKYEQVVQWLGENPNILKEAEKRYVNTTLGVLVAVLKASGYALVLCLGMGGLIGGLLFSYRRAQQKDVTAFSDAGGMLRLNLDEMTAETNPARLLRERN
jgi:hypothetical protein